MPVSSRPIVIAHRGASGYLPEHTLVSKALAVGMGADYLEQDVVATRDGELIVFHDLTLECVTDVRDRFPDRARSDGHFYCLDFTLEELRTLSVSERRVSENSTPRYPGRFPEGAGRFPIPTVEEEIRFVQGLCQSTGRQIGIYPEIKNPGWHRQQGMDPGVKLLAILSRFGYTQAESPVFLQCFDAEELQRLRKDIGCRLRMVQLLEGNAPPVESRDLERIAHYADAIGPAMQLIATRQESTISPFEPTSLVSDAHSLRLLVHPYTLRKDDLPVGINSFAQLLDIVLRQAGADGVFTDFPDLAASFIKTHFDE